MLSHDLQFRDKFAFIIFRPTFSMGRKIIICVAFFFQILPNLHAPSLDYLVT